MDTIAAISTPAGRSAIAVIRASGDGVVRVIERTLGDPLAERRPTLRWLAHPETSQRVDRVLATFFPRPESYTGEDLLELSCHGGVLVPQLALDAVIAAGARLAEPGEFTRRAYLNGKIDLLQAEAILDLIDGRSRAMHSSALLQLDRGLSQRLEDLRQAIIRAEALLVYEIDFPEEDEGPVPPGQIDSAAAEVGERIDLLLETAGEGELIREGALTVIAGLPNAGKSSLFNALCGVERVIVTEEPGTTRDAVETVVSLGGYPFRLVDTAGLRETETRIERMGIEVAHRYLQDADLVLFCAEAGRPLSAEERGFLSGIDDRALIIVRTKSDLADGTTPPETGFATPVEVSALSGEGLGELMERLVASVFSGAVALAAAEAPLLTRERHVRELRRARSEVNAFITARADGYAPEVAATHLREAAHALEELLGVISPDDLLEHVFADFCIGK